MEKPSDGQWKGANGPQEERGEIWHDILRALVLIIFKNRRKGGSARRGGGEGVSP